MAKDMVKETRTMSELRALVEAEVRKYPEFRDVAPQSPYLREPGDDGANWDLPYWSGPEPLVDRARRRIAPALRELRRHYLGRQDL